MTLEEYEEMAKQIEASKKLLSSRLGKYIDVYRIKKICISIRSQLRLIATGDVGNICAYYNASDASNITNISINFENYGIDINFEEQFSGCSSESCGFTLPVDIILGTDEEYAEYLVKLKDEILVHNLREQDKLETRIKEVNQSKIDQQTEKDLAELKRLKDKYETSN